MTAGEGRTFATYWNKTWGRYRAFVTDHSKRVEIWLADDSRVIVSPDDPGAFLQGRGCRMRRWKLKLTSSWWLANFQETRNLD